jgi:hypothetical protein
MNEEVLTLQEILIVLKRRALLVVLTIVICLVSVLAVSKLIPKKYKAGALLNLQATYFEVPLLGDSIVGSRDSSEMHAQKEALIRLALSDTFIDGEGEKYHIYRSAPGTSARAFDRDYLRKNIDYFSSSTTTFQISAIGNSAENAYGLASDVLDQIITVLVNERQKNIMNYRDSLRKQLEALGVATTQTSEGQADIKPEVLKVELEKDKRQLQLLESQYSSNHPAVLQMKGKVRTLERLLEQAPKQGAIAPAPNALLTIDSTQKGRRTDFGEELLKKINYLDIALEIERNKKDLPYLEVLEHPSMPSTYFFPKDNAFVIGGLLLGFLLAALEVMFLEYRRLTKITPTYASQELGIPLLGAMPVMTSTNYHDR